MRYVGSKKRFTKQLNETFKNELTRPYYYEPFVGGGNSITKINHNNKFGNDIDTAIISVLDALSSGWIPPEKVTEKEYQNYKLLPETDPLHGWAAYACSFGGKKWGGFARDKTQKRDLTNEQYKAALKENYSNIRFYNVDYTQLVIPDNSLVYCDPPYNNTQKYSQSFDNNKFFDWVDYISKTSKVFISGYECPKDWNIVLEIETKNFLGQNYKQAKELLFTR